MQSKEVGGNQGHSLDFPEEPGRKEDSAEPGREKERKVREISRDERRKIQRV